MGPVDDRAVKELYIADYDGNNVQRVTVGRSLNIFPAWCAEGQAIAYTSYRRGYQDIFVSYIYRGTLTSPAGGSEDVHNWLSACSPDGSRIAFTSSRNGDPDLYVMNSDGTNVRRITSHPAIDTSPTWSPTGNQLAFASDRTGAQQIYVIGADGTGLRRLTYESYCSRPTWSPEPYNEIAYTSPNRARLRHQGARPGHQRGAPAHVWPREQREPGVCAEWAAHCVHVHAVGRWSETDLHDRTGRQGPSTGHQHRQQRDAQLVPLEPFSSLCSL